MKIFSGFGNFQSKDSVIYSGTQELIDSEEGLARYNEDIVKKMHALMRIGAYEKATILEFGAGTGAIAEVWRRFFGLEPVCLEIDPGLISMLKEKQFTVHENIESIKTKFDYVYTSNVLEHIEDDVATLSQIKSVMKNGAIIAIYVPALQFLFSDLDKQVGHYRRYSKQQLTQKVTEAGFVVISCTYNDSIGVLASITLKIFGYKNKLGLGTKKSMRLYDSLIYPISMFLDNLFFKKIIGKNLLMIATVKT